MAVTALPSPLSMNRVEVVFARHTNIEPLAKPKAANLLLTSNSLLAGSTVADVIWEGTLRDREIISGSSLLGISVVMITFGDGKDAHCGLST